MKMLAVDIQCLRYLYINGRKKLIMTNSRHRKFWKNIIFDKNKTILPNFAMLEIQHRFLGELEKFIEKNNIKSGFWKLINFDFFKSKVVKLSPIPSTLFLNVLHFNHCVALLSAGIFLVERFNKSILKPNWNSLHNS